MNEPTSATASEVDPIIELTDAEIATVTGGAMTDRGDTILVAMTD